MIVTKKAISRRAILQGMGAAVGLPLLDAMLPALSAAPAPTRRFGVVYHPNGHIWDKWVPKGTGANFEISPTLSSLEPFRDKLLVITNLASDQAEALGDGGGDHSRAAGAYLTGVHVKKSDSALENGISMDQLIAKANEKDTQLSSLQITVDDNSLLGSCDIGYSCAYSSTLSWLTPTLPLPAENNPRVLFERMFGATDRTDAKTRAARLEEDRSLLDSVNDRVKQLQRKLSPSDNRKVNDYLTALRDVERRIQKAEEQRDKEMPDVVKPAGIPDGFEAHVRLLYDLQLLAFQADLTRVFTFMWGREQNDVAYRELDIRDGHHSLSHHSGQTAAIDACAKIDAHQSLLFAKFLGKLKASQDGDLSLLDRSLIMYGSGMSDGNAHTHHDIPMTLIGGGNGQLKGGRHIRYEALPMSNLLLTMLDMAKIPTEGYLDPKYSDATGKLDVLSL